MRIPMNFQTILLLAFLTILSASTASAQRGRGQGERAPRADFPTVDQMAEAIDADAEQRAVLAEARLALLEAVKERRGEQGRRGRDREPRVSPLEEFLVTAAPALDTRETIALVELMAAHHPSPRGGQGLREGHRGQGPQDGRRGDRRGPGQGPGQGAWGGRGHHDEDRLVERLDLSAEQKDQVEALYGKTMGALMGLKRQAAGEPTQAQRDAADAIRAEHQSELAEILTDAQSSELMKLQAERRATRSAEGAERRAKMQEQRLESMAIILDLNASQKSAVENAMRDAEQKATVERGKRMAKGGPMPHLFDQGPSQHDLRDEARAAITEVLDPAQRELFAQLQALRLEGRRGHGPGGHGRGDGPGHGPGGGFGRRG